MSLLQKFVSNAYQGIETDSVTYVREVTDRNILRAAAERYKAETEGRQAKLYESS